MTRFATFTTDDELNRIKREQDAVRVAQIGLAGGIGVCHINEYARNPHFKLVGGFDLYPRDPKVAEASGQITRHGGRIYSSFEEILADPQVEAIDTLHATSCSIGRWQWRRFQAGEACAGRSALGACIRMMSRR